MEPKKLTRLQEEQLKAIDDTKTKITQLEKYKEDYTALRNKLKTLPDKLSHEIMVPFGKLAFMPGKIVHTNEILVLLGDNWFVERSASQAAEIANRRIKDLDTKLVDLNKQRKLLEPRLNFTSEFRTALENSSEVKEIVEEYDEEKERLWDEQHRRNVRKYKAELRQSSTNKTIKENKAEGKPATDSELWSRLDELEMLEKEKGELNSEFDGDSNGSADDISESDKEKILKRRVSWADVEEKTLQRNSPVDPDIHEAPTDEDDTDDSDDDETNRPVQRVIRFTHTPAPTKLSHQVSDSGDGRIQSPADLYKLYSPKSILKKTSGSGDVSVACVKETDSTFCDNSGALEPFHLSEEVEPPKVITESLHDADVPLAFSKDILPPSSSQKAFTGLVLEKSTTGPLKSIETEKHIVSEVKTSAQDPPKRISKFKAGRMSQQSH